MTNAYPEAPSTPRARPSDLTARARIRNAALDLYAAEGEDRVPMRAVAAAAGVTVGLVQHHFGTKDGLREAVDELVVEHFVDALAAAPREQDGVAGDSVVRRRNAAVREMFVAHPEVARYLQRAFLDPLTRGAPLINRLTVLIVSELDALRREGHVSSTASPSTQGLRMALGQVGEVFLEPLVEAIWRGLDDGDTPHPRVRLIVEE